jgi:hypothetical protein
MFGWAKTTGSRFVFKAVFAFLETVCSLLDDPKPNDTFSINRVDLARDFGIERVFEREEMGDGADFERNKKC